ncbi:adenosylcobinamide-GDP ribazoletransferase [Gordonia sp. OPL2]|uniref:adenosylcobinamide-GDP ribazoletransferase n=1 Tax=Gordonia sp. OPL2 TaxID=2486274 RepID=UPI001655BDB1|nr:adenosylcobinamide-GDP ribazoletransferase [Gordonia sp. OPL2]ROZ87654.1 adenosylcobinamide-GDP ribazoletransferase [Gordonia sp. OPL2]
MLSPARAVYVAVSWMTVAPVPQPRMPMDRSVGAAVMTAIPVVGILLGAGAAGLAAAMSTTDLPDAMIGALVVVALALATRGMHLDGLADTADGLGCYGPPERVAEVMRSGPAGPFAVATVTAVMIVQLIGFGSLIGQHRWYELALAIALGRIVAVIGCRRRLSAAHPTGFGALVAGTQHVSVIVWTVVASAAGFLCGLSPESLDVGAAVQGVVVTAVVVVAGWWFTAHCARRMGGINGDVLGAGIELGVTVAVVGLLV